MPDGALLVSDDKAGGSAWIHYTSGALAPPKPPGSVRSQPPRRGLGAPGRARLILGLPHAHCARRDSYAYPRSDGNAIAPTADVSTALEECAHAPVDPADRRGDHHRCRRGVDAGRFFSQETRPPGAPRPGDAVQDAQTPRAAPAQRPEQQKTEHDSSGPFAADSAERAVAGARDPAREGRDQRLRLRPRPAQRQEADADVRGDHEGRRRRQAEGHGGAAQAARDALRPDAEKLDPNAEKMSRGKPLPVGPTARLRDGPDLGQLGGDAARRDPRGGRVPLSVAAAPKHTPGGQVFPQMQIDDVPAAASGSTSTSTCPRRSCPSSRRPSSCRTGRSWATCRAARSSRSTTSTGCSRTS